MQIIKSFFKLLIFIFPVSVFAQSTYVTQGAKEIYFTDRLEIKQQTNTNLNFSALRPFNRRAIVRQAEFLDSARMGYADSTGVDKYKEWTDLDLTPVDEYNLRRLLMNNTEWVSVPRQDFASRKKVFRTFYGTKSNLFEVNNKDFFLALNPVLQFNQGAESNNSRPVFLNSRGVMVRGLIAKKVGFSALITDNQERGPLFVQQQVNTFKAVPGVGFYKPFKTNGTDYFDARGYITFAAVKNYVDVQFGFDKNFIGNGYRSLFLSDWGNSYLFAKLNTRIWKLNYQNIFMELNPQFKKAGDTLLNRKYAAIHHLSVNVTKWLNIGLFESVIFGRTNRFDFQYLNPLIFYRHIESNNGSRDNAIAGLDFKANIAHRAQLYGQVILDEFILSDIRTKPTSWTNKWGVQAGVKYVDAFGVRNLDLQLETNRVRPFVYSHTDTIANYTHYNQPLAHPLGASFQEVIAIARWQPSNKWYINARIIYYNQGLDSAGKNFGGNIFKANKIRNGDVGYNVAGGNKATCLNGLLAVTYEWKENLFFDFTFQYRNYKTTLTKPTNITLFGAGIRLNMFRRDYDF
jgi:hypothetical protein